MSLKFPEKYRYTPGIAAGLALMDNVFIIKRKGAQINCVASIDGGQWEHVSVTVAYPGKKPKRCPTWEEMCFVKDLFWDKENRVAQVHPRQAEYVNLQEFCLHLWRPVGGFPDNFPG